MKISSIIYKIGIALCVIMILLVSVNWMTGFINPIMTSGASVICLISLTTTLYALSTELESQRNRSNKLEN